MATKRKPPVDTNNKIIAQIIQLSRDYSAKSLATWKQAVKAAENTLQPNRVKLYDLYTDLNYDLHVMAVRRKLLTTATGARFNVIDAAGNINTEATAQLKARWFEKFISHLCDTLFWGHTLLQINTADPATGVVDMELIPRKHVVPEAGAWVPMAGTYDLHPYRNTPAMDWLIELGEPADFGWFNLLAKEILYKKVAFICWSTFQERFGNPLAKAKTNTRDLAAVNRMEKFLKDMAGGSYAIIDNAEEIDFVQTSQTDSYNVYDALIERCNSEISKAILLNIMSLDIGKNGSRAQADTHADNGQAALNAFMRLVEYEVSDNLLPKLTLHGFKYQGLRIKFVEEKTVDNNTFEQHKWLFETFEIDPQFFIETYGVPITGVKPAQQNTGTGAPAKLKAGTDSIMKLHAALYQLYNHKH